MLSASFVGSISNEININCQIYRIMEYIINEKKKTLTIFLPDQHQILKHKIKHKITSVSNKLFVVCNHCNSIYDIRKTKNSKSYQDCTDFTTPCCNFEHADDRRDNIINGSYKHFIPLPDYLERFKTKIGNHRSPFGIGS